MAWNSPTFNKHNSRRNRLFLLLRRRRQIPLLVQIRNDLPHRLLHRDLMVPDMNLRVERRLVGSTDPRKLLDHPLPRLLIQPLGIPLLRHLDRHVDVHLHKRQPLRLLSPRGRRLLVQLPRHIPIRPVRTDKRRDRHTGAVREELRHLRDAPDVLVAVLLAESEVLVQPEPDVVPVEAVRGHAAVAEQLLLELDGDGGFARGGEARQPDGQAVLLAEGEALGARKGGGVVGDVAVA